MTSNLSFCLKCFFCFLFFASKWREYEIWLKKMWQKQRSKLDIMQHLLYFWPMVLNQVWFLALHSKKYLSLPKLSLFCKYFLHIGISKGFSIRSPWTKPTSSEMSQNIKPFIQSQKIFESLKKDKSTRLPFMRHWNTHPMKHYEWCHQIRHDSAI